MAAALCDHICKNRQRQPAKDAQQDHIRKQLQPNMIQCHGNQRNKFQLIAGKTGFVLVLHGASQS